MEREKEGVDKVISGGMLVLIGAAAIITVVTAGAGSPLLLTVTAIAGGTAVAMGSSDVIEGVQDIYYGINGSDKDSLNIIKDYVFQGNEDLYGFTESLAALIATYGVYAIGRSAGASPNIVDEEAEGTGNLSFDTGKAGEEYLAKLVGGDSQVYFKTSQGGRYIDQLAGDIAYESKVGYTTLTDFVKKQILKDAELIETGVIKGSNWNFFRSDVTGKIGASKPLLEFLEKHGITYTIHY